MMSAGAPASVIRLPQSSMADIAICETLPLSGMILSRTAMVSGRSRLYQWEYPETRQQRVSRPQAILTTTAPWCFSRYVCVRGVEHDGAGNDAAVHGRILIGKREVIVEAWSISSSALASWIAPRVLLSFARA